MAKRGGPETEVLVEVNVSAEPGKAGIAPERLGEFIEGAAPARVTGLMTMPPFSQDPEASRPHFARLAELAGEHGLEPALDGHLAGLGGRGRRGRDDRPPGHGAVRVKGRQTGHNR